MKSGWVCPYNCEVDCKQEDYAVKCATCGWNPSVDKARREKTRELYFKKMKEDHHE